MKIAEYVSKGIERIYYGGVKIFWTKKEYEYQDLIINGFVVRRELPGQSQKTIPYARVDIFYDTMNGLGRKSINGVYFKVYKEACKYLSLGEKDELNRKWLKAKYEGKYNFKDSCEKPIYDDEIPNWITGKKGKTQEETKDKVKFPEKNIKESPLQDVITTNQINPKHITGKENLSTLYKHIQGDRELSKGKAIEYAKTLGVAPASLTFEAIKIPIWSNVVLSASVDLFSEIYQKAALLKHKTFLQDLDKAVNANKDNVMQDKLKKFLVDFEIKTGHCFIPFETSNVTCPAELYRIDIKAVQVKDKKSIYDGFVAYYYHADKISDEAHNKLCLIKEIKNLKSYYYLGIYQLYGTKKRILNPDPTSENQIIADDVNPEIVAPIVSFTKPEALDANKVMTTNIADIQKLGELIREDQNKKADIKTIKDKIEMEKIIYDIKDAAVTAREIKSKKNIEHAERLLKEAEITNAKITSELNQFLSKFYYEAQRKEAEKKRFMSLLDRTTDDFKIPDFIKNYNEKKIA